MAAKRAKKTSEIDLKDLSVRRVKGGFRVRRVFYSGATKYSRLFRKWSDVMRCYQEEYEKYERAIGRVMFGGAIDSYKL